MSGTLSTAVWTPAGSLYRASADLEIPAGATLTIEAGVSVLFAEDADLVVRGALVVRGTGASWVVFQSATEGERWGGVIATGSFASCEWDYLELTGASRATIDGQTQIAAVNFTRGARAFIRDSWFHDFPDNMIENNRGAELVIYDSLLENGEEGIHSAASYAHIERVHIRNVSGHSDHIDYDNDSTPRSVIRDCLLELNEEDDGIDLSGSNCLVENVIVREMRLGKAFSIDSPGSPEINGAVIHDCLQGLVCKDSSTPVFRHVTVARCERAVDCYEKVSGQGGGHGSADSLILWGNENSVVLDDLSTFTMTYSDAEGGYPGEGNMDDDPLFMNPDPAVNDFHLRAGSPAAGAGLAGEDMGAYPAALVQTGLFVRGDANGDERLDIADAVAILVYLGLGRPVTACLDALDVDDLGGVDITDARTILLYLFENGPEIPAPYPEAGIDPTEGDPYACGNGWLYYR